ncbi:spore coat protein GerQ [Bacillus shivajii]|uniref:spore coat protein GerQ n=1 Tax=Bacillus shivajii TaxID=1983719 RepID=UPI001CFB7373|nr:spore coat protein GerQ [Bacillus shivajii]UCZ53082.1 spore coat protein GerQ [Bacillus shivajii]
MYSGGQYSPYTGAYGANQFQQQSGQNFQGQYPGGFPPGAVVPQQHQLMQQQRQQPFFDMPGMLPVEQSYIENILRLNRGKVGTFYMTYEQNEKWNAKVFKGVVEAAGRDHIILSDPQTGKRYLLLMVNLDYVTFDEELEYEYPFNDIDPAEALATYPPR